MFYHYTFVTRGFGFIDDTYVKTSVKGSKGGFRLAHNKKSGKRLHIMKDRDKGFFKSFTQFRASDNKANKNKNKKPPKT